MPATDAVLFVRRDLVPIIPGVAAGVRLWALGCGAPVFSEVTPKVRLVGTVNSGTSCQWFVS